MCFTLQKKFSEADCNIGSYILKYDWAGTPLCIYKLDCPASCFTIDSEETVIYAAVQDENGASVVSYDMPAGRIWVCNSTKKFDGETVHGADHHKIW